MQVNFLKRQIELTCSSPDDDQRMELKDKLEFINGVIEMYKKTEQLYKLKELAIYQEFETLDECPRREEMGKTFTKMTVHLTMMEVQMYKVLGVENSWFSMKIHEIKRWVTENLEDAAAGVGILSGALAGLFWIGYALIAEPIYYLGLVKGMAALLAAAAGGVAVGVVVGSFAVLILYFTWTESCFTPVTDKALTHIQQVKSMAAVLETVPNDAFCQKLDEMVALSDKVVGELPDQPDRLCCICLEEGSGVIAPVRTPGCQGHHYMCRDHWGNYCSSRAGRNMLCPVCRT